MTGAAPEHQPFMRLALEEAQKAAAAEEVPIGAVIVREGALLAAAFNRSVSACDPTAHAEVLALRAAARRTGSYRLPGTTLYVTVEPCLMCVGALLLARVERVVFGALEPKFGAIQSLVEVKNLASTHRFETIGGVLAPEAGGLLVDFFKRRRE
jgi:tRNA(adenine34) deaminase